MAALLAKEYCVPHVIKTWAGNTPNNASCPKIISSLNFFPPLEKSFMAKGARKRVARSIGAQTVKYGPT
jgi:hypothetical protein